MGVCDVLAIHDACIIHSSLSSTCGYFVYYLYISCACLWECINFYELIQL